ncbi:MAG TPA: diguanylate cyclase [Steroidobacteraceae bacterium]
MPKDDLNGLLAAASAGLNASLPGGRRSTDRTEVAGDASQTARHLLARRAELDRALRADDPSLLNSSPPAPIALMMLDSASSRERFRRLLPNANIQIEEATDNVDALAKLEQRVHALFFTDRLDLIWAARQLPRGVLTHIVFVDPAGKSGCADAFRAGANDAVADEGRGEEFWAHLTTARRIVELSASLHTAITDNRILSTIDELTRCGSRRFFQHQFPREVERAIRLRRPLTLAIADIDHFKRINDSHGHQAGDDVLREFASRITGALRVGDDWVARVGGEEFAIVLPDVSSGACMAVAERLRQVIADASFHTSAGSVSVSASLGVCSLDMTGQTLDESARELVKGADEALYASKRNGRNVVTLAGERPAIPRVRGA